MNRKNIRKAVIAVLAIALCSIVVYSLTKQYVFPSRTSVFCQDCNILLISLDTCGAKHMSTYGYERDTTPNLTALAEEGILFKNMHANATWTLPSHVSIFTGLYPMVHQVQEAYDTYLDPSAPLLPDILQKNGYETYFYAPDSEPNIAPVHVYNRGVSYWDKHYWEYRGREEEYLELALTQLEKNTGEKKKTFMFFHTYMCHGPYSPEDQPLLYTDNKIPSLPLKRTGVYDTPFSEGFFHYLLRRLPQGIQDSDFHVAPEKIKEFYLSLQQAPDFFSAKQIYEDAVRQEMWGELSFGDYEEDFHYWAKINETNKEHVEYIKALYDQGVHTLDEKLFSLFRELRAPSSWSRNTIVIITGDHGEEFMEHGELMHTTLYEFNTHVPLIMLIPGVGKKTISEHVQSVDIAPTVLDMVGVPDALSFNGASMVPLFFGGSLGNRLLLAEAQENAQSHILTIREGDWKLFVYKNADGSLLPYELYNTKKDPAEQTNILGKNIKKANSLIKRYRAVEEKSFLMK